MSGKVSLFAPAKIGDFRYLFFIVGWNDYATQLKEEMSKQLDAFGADLGTSGEVLQAYKSSEYQTFEEVAGKRWAPEFLEQLQNDVDPCMLVIDRDFDAFDPAVDRYLRDHTFGRDVSSLDPDAMALAVMPMTVSVLGVLRGTLTRDVDLVVPALLDEVDAFAAGVVLAAVLLPVLGVAGRDAQVDRRTLHRNGDRRGLHDDRLLVHHLRGRPVADLDPAINTRLADGDRDSDVGGAGGARSERCSDDQ